MQEVVLDCDMADEHDEDPGGDWKSDDYDGGEDEAADELRDELAEQIDEGIVI